MSSDYDNLQWCKNSSSDSYDIENSLNILDLHNIKIPICINNGNDEGDDAFNWFCDNILHSYDSCYIYLGDYEVEKVSQQRLRIIILFSKGNFNEEIVTICKKNFLIDFNSIFPTIILFQHSELIRIGKKYTHIHSLKTKLDKKKTESDLYDITRLSNIFLHDNKSDYRVENLIHTSIYISRTNNLQNVKKIVWNSIVCNKEECKKPIIKHQEKSMKALTIPTTDNLFFSPTKSSLNSVKYGVNLRTTTSSNKIKSKEVEPIKYHENIPNIHAEILTDYQMSSIIDDIGLDTIPLDVLANAIDTIHEKLDSEYGKNNIKEINRQQGLLAMKLFQNFRWKMGTPTTMSADKYDINKSITIDVDQVQLSFFVNILYNYYMEFVGCNNSS